MNQYCLICLLCWEGVRRKLICCISCFEVFVEIWFCFDFVSILVLVLFLFLVLALTLALVLALTLVLVLIWFGLGLGLVLILVLGFGFGFGFICGKQWVSEEAWLFSVCYLIMCEWSERQQLCYVVINYEVLTLCSYNFCSN